jgi:hypothetical protein
MENLWIGIVALMTDPIAILLFFAALITGLLFAAIPGINMVTLGAIILPFTIYLEFRHLRWGSHGHFVQYTWFRRKCPHGL